MRSTALDLEENAGSSPFDSGLHRIFFFFFDMFLQARATRAPKCKTNYIKLKSICTVRGMIIRMKGDPLNRRRYLLMYVR